jgi:hypothetical protein
MAVAEFGAKFRARFEAKLGAFQISEDSIALDSCEIGWCTPETVKIGDCNGSPPGTSTAAL